MNEYQEACRQYDLFRQTEDYKSPAFLEKVLGLVGEAGETADKIKKVIRDKDGIISETDRKEIAKELGDTLWYVATIARYIKMPLAEVAEMNLEKLESRKQRNLLSGEGDNR
ncbi:nucleoside triphosphate pyrophosphohydrolase family protein [Candidatus Saccharibacteria bacterium]|nr:nucleoside triphosphate pyrophosphohydrolase family protein [Candidatus Saccharibacteria bacterium]